MRRFAAAFLLPLGFAAAALLGTPSAGGAPQVRILQIHPTFVVKGPSSASRAVAQVDVERIPPGYRLRVSPQPYAVHHRRIGATLVFRPALARGQITVVVTRTRVPELAWFGYSQQIMITQKGPVPGRKLCVTLSGQLHALPCPRPTSPPPAETSPTTAAKTQTTPPTPTTTPPTTQQPPPPPPPTTTQQQPPPTTTQQQPPPTTTSQSPPTTTAAPPPVDDLNGDGRVDCQDLDLLKSNYGKNTSVGDMNHDGVVNITDLSIFLSNYTGPSCP